MIKIKCYKDNNEPKSLLSEVRFPQNLPLFQFSPKSAPNLMAYFAGEFNLLPWVKTHNIKSTYVDYYHVEGFQD